MGQRGDSAASSTTWPDFEPGEHDPIKSVPVRSRTQPGGYYELFVPGEVYRNFMNFYLRAVYELFQLKVREYFWIFVSSPNLTSKVAK